MSADKWVEPIQSHFNSIKLLYHTISHIALEKNFHYQYIISNAISYSTLSWLVGIGNGRFSSLQTLYERNWIVKPIVGSVVLNICLLKY